MTIILKLIYYILFAITLFYGLYLLVMGLFVFKKSKKTNSKQSKKLNEFSIIIAARNEEKVIGSLVRSLKKLNYPKDKYEINVIVNNCTDKTAEAAKKAGAIVTECTEKVKSKGEVLKFVFNKFKSRKDIAAYVIFDADNVVHPDFLLEMNKSLNNGYKVAQGFRDTKNLSDNWLSGCYALFYYSQNFFINQARRKINLSASINGTGFMVKKSLIDEKGFLTTTLTEDIEYSGICALGQEKIDFVLKAITYDEQPTKFKEAWKQRKRWSVGSLQCFNRYAKDLIKHLFKDRNLTCLDLLIVYISPLIQVLTLLNFLLLIIIKIIEVTPKSVLMAMFINQALFFSISYIVMMILSAILVKIYNKKIKEAFMGIVTYPFFFFTWIPINIIALFKKNLAWEPISHDRDIDISSVIP